MFVPGRIQYSLSPYTAWLPAIVRMYIAPRALRYSICAWAPWLVLMRYRDPATMPRALQHSLFWQPSHFLSVLRLPRAVKPRSSHPTRRRLTPLRTADEGVGKHASLQNSTLMSTPFEHTFAEQASRARAVLDEIMATSAQCPATV